MRAYQLAVRRVSWGRFYPLMFAVQWVRGWKRALRKCNVGADLQRQGRSLWGSEPVVGVSWLVYTVACVFDGVRWHFEQGSGSAQEGV